MCRPWSHWEPLVTTALTLSVDDAMLARLEQAAAASDMTREALAATALAMFLEERSLAASAPLLDWQRERTLRGMADADRGAFASSEELDRIRRKYND